MENTLIVYSSDQGFVLGENGWFDKRWMDEVSSRVPLLMQWPGHIQPGTSSAALVQNIDFAPTLLAAYDRAFKTDTESAFGGIIAFNRTLDAATAKAIVDRQFVEVIIAPDVDKDVEAKVLRVLADDAKVIVCLLYTSPSPRDS